MSKDNGGPAFPTVDANREEDYGTRGMTLRDYFAAKAMQPLLRANGLSITSPSAGGDNHSVARVAYAMADAMLEARGK